MESGWAVVVVVRRKPWLVAVAAAGRPEFWLGDLTDVVEIAMVRSVVRDEFLVFRCLCWLSDRADDLS